MNEKNTQNAVVPTKDTRQYKHTPRHTKRLISKIFAFVACLLLLATFTIPTFALSASDSNENVPVHPYAPTAFSYPSARLVKNAMIDFPSSFLYNSPNTWFNVNGNSLLTTRERATLQDPLDGRVVCNLNDDEIPILTFYHERIFYTDDYANIAPTYKVEFDNNVYCHVYISGYFGFKANDQTSFAHMDKVVFATTYGRREVEFNFADIMRFVRQYNGMGNSAGSLVHSYDFRIGIVAYDDDLYEDIAVDDDITKFTVDYPYINQYTPRESYIYVPMSIETTIPPTLDGKGLLSWVGDALSGAFNAPLIPLGKYSITIGGLLSACLGIGLVIVFIKIFMGG